MTSFALMTRWALPALALLLASPANAEDLYAADQLAACLIGSAVVRIEKWDETPKQATDQAWEDCAALVGRIPEDRPDAEMSAVDEVIHFVDEMVARITEQPSAVGYNLTPPDTF